MQFVGRPVWTRTRFGVESSAALASLVAEVDASGCSMFLRVRKEPCTGEPVAMATKAELGFLRGVLITGHFNNTCLELFGDAVPGINHSK